MPATRSLPQRRGPLLALLLAATLLVLAAVWGALGGDLDGAIAPPAVGAGVAAPGDGEQVLAPARATVGEAEVPEIADDSAPGGRFALAGSAASPAAEADPEPEAELEVLVVEGDTGTAIPGARVVQGLASGPRETETDGDGRARLVDTEAPLGVSRVGFVGLWAPRIPATRPLVVELRRSARLFGRVIDKGGAAVPGVRLELRGALLAVRSEPGWRMGEREAEESVGVPSERAGDTAEEAEEPVLSCASDEEGAFAFDSLEPGLYSLAGWTSGELAPFLDTRVDVEVGDAERVFELERGATLVGTVHELRANVPVAGVRVELAPDWELDGDVGPPVRRAVTDEAGRFEVGGLSRGSWRVGLRTPWGAVVMDEVVLPGPDETVEERFQIRPPAVVSGRVFDPDGRAVPGARVLVTARPDDRDYDWGALGSPRLDSPFLAEVEADGEGAYIIEAVPTREGLWIFAMPPGPPAEGERPGRFEPLRVVENEVRTGLDLVLAGWTSVEGLVTDPDGVALAGVEVEAFHVRWGTTSPGRTARTDSEGRFEVGPLPWGRARLQFHHPSYRDAVQGLDLVEGDPQTCEQVLEPAHPVVGWVVDEAGWGVRGARISAELNASSRKVRATTDATGRFELEELTDGRWKVRAKATGFASPEPVEVDVPDPFGLEFIVERKDDVELGGVRGELVWDASGEPVWDLEFRGARGGAVQLDGSRFEIHGMRPGRAKLVATAPGMESVKLPAVQVLPGATLDVGRHVAQRATRVRVVVRDAKGARLHGAKVVLQSQPKKKGGRGKGSERLKEGEERGVYEHQAVPRAKWRLVVRHGEHRTHSEIVEVGGATRRFEVRLVPE